MIKPAVNKKARTILIKSKSKREFFLLHGYTGSPTDFNGLGKYLNKRFNATVKIIRLKGHGEVIENLDNLNYSDFLSQAESELKKDLSNGKEIVLGGVSLGAFIALQLSAKYPVKGVISISSPYKYKLPVKLFTFIEPLIKRKHWKKPISEKERELRKKAFYYDLHLRAFKIIKQAKKDLKEEFCNVKVPCFIINIASDKVFHKKTAEIIKRKLSSAKSTTLIIKEKEEINHNPFYSPHHEKLYKEIGDFVEKENLFSKKVKIYQHIHCK